MAKILLIDVDSKIPNLALMQISAYHKAKGHEVRFNMDDPDIVYISCIFKKNGGDAKGIAQFYPNAKVHIGGSGINYDWLPKEIWKIKPDYNLYTRDKPEFWHSMGFTTRGCIRHCPFCIVPDKEGSIQRWQHIKEFHDHRFNRVYLLDNNIYADKEWFFSNTDYLLEHDLTVNISQGMDIRLLDPEIAQRLAELRHSSHTMRFAFDNIGDEKAVRRGIDILKQVGINTRQDVKFYVLVGYNTTEDEDRFRCRLLKELDCAAFVMPYVKNKWTKKIARWANRPWIYWSIDIDEYNRSVV